MTESYSRTLRRWERYSGLSLGTDVVMAINHRRDIRITLLNPAHFFTHASCGKCFRGQLGTQR